jgi:hypothetical protein
MTIADEARDNAIHCEMVKYAYRQSKDGVVVSFVVHPNDIPAALSTSHIGSRYMVALVQVGDDERPIQQPAKETRAKPSLAEGRPSEKAKRDWDTFEPAQQAGMRSNDKRFAEFLQEEYPQVWREHQNSKDCIKDICVCTHSRSELGADPRKRVLWNQLDRHFDAWLIKERVGA